MRQRKQHLMLMVSLLLAAGFMATSMASYTVSRAALRSQIITTSLPLTSDTIYSEIQRDLLRPIQIASQMASDTFLKDWILQGEQDVARIARYLDAIKTRYDTFASFLVSHRTKRYYHADGVLKIVRPDEPRDGWYYRVAEMDAPYEINIDPDMANQDAMTIFINYKIFDDSGSFLGATGVGLTVTAVRQIIEDYQQRYQRTVYFTDRFGNITLHGNSIPDDVRNLSEREGLATLTDTILNADRSRLTYRRNGDKVHLNSRFITDFQWHLIVEQSETATTRSIHTALMINLLISAGITVVVLVLTNVTVGAYQKRLERMAMTDKLTDATNRQAFGILFDQARRESLRWDSALSLLLMDIDRFKQVNDTFGHMVGDAVIRGVVDIARTLVREADVVCRWGGEEFVLLLKDCTLADGQTVAGKIRRAVRKTPFRCAGQSVRVTVSIGVAQFRAADDEESLVHRADQALYRAKQAGRDRVASEGDVHLVKG